MATIEFAKPAEEKTRKLLVLMTADERALKALTLSEKLQETGKIEEKAKEASDGFKKQLKSLELDVNALAQEVRSGKEAREVDVFKRSNVEARTWEVIRADTGEVIDSSTMTTAEIRESKQQKLVLMDDHKAKKAAKAEQP